MPTPRRMLRLPPLAVVGLLWWHSYAGSDSYKRVLRGHGVAVDCWRGRVLLLQYNVPPHPGDEEEIYAAPRDFQSAAGLRWEGRHVSQGPGDANVVYTGGPAVIEDSLMKRGAGFSAFGDTFARIGMAGVTVPFWAIAVVVVIPLVSVRRTRRRPGVCVACGYDLSGNVSGVCPECGTATSGRPS